MQHSRYYSAENLASLKAEYQQVPAYPQASTMMAGFPPSASDVVDRRNWLQAPFNKWGFNHVEQLMPTIRLQPANAPAPIAPAMPELQNQMFTSVCGDTVSLAKHLDCSHTDAFIVLHKGQMVHEQYAEHQAANQQHIMFSVTKSLIGLLAEQLIAEGRLDERSLTQTIIPELEGSAFADASVRQLMDMAVGIEYQEIYDDPDSESSQFGYACGFVPAPEKWQSCSSLYDYLPRLQKKGEHGGLFHYVTATTEVLAWCIERVTGEACHQHLMPIWHAAGCEHDGYFVADPKGRNVCGAGFNATARDMARLGQLLLNNANPTADQTSQASLQTALKTIRQGSDPALLGADEDFSFWTPGASYRSQWYVFHADDVASRTNSTTSSNAIMAGGIHGQYLYIDFDAELVIVKQSSLPVAVSNIDSDTVAMFRALSNQFAPKE